MRNAERYLERADEKLQSIGWRAPSDEPEMRRGVALLALKLADFDQDRAIVILGDFVGVFRDLEEFEESTEMRWSPEHYIALNLNGDAAVFHARPGETVHPSLEWSANPDLGAEPEPDEPDDEYLPTTGPWYELKVRQAEVDYERYRDAMWP